VRSLSLWDRVVFGSISAIVGAVLGALAAFLAAVAFDSSPEWTRVTGFSILFFFGVGALRGPDAGFFVGQAFSAVAGIGAVEVGVASGGTEYRDEPRSWNSVWLLGVWLAVVTALAWRS
jgi:hypothetical protein